MKTVRIVKRGIRAPSASADTPAASNSWIRAFAPGMPRTLVWLRPYPSALRAS